MQWKTFAILYGLSVPVLLLLDFLWLGIISSDFYKGQFGSLLGDTNWIAVIVLYPIMIAGITYFASYPASVKESTRLAVVLGAFFGFVLYATYDLTNLAVVRDWPLFASVVDIAWGTFLCATTAGIAVFVRNLFTV